MNDDNNDVNNDVNQTSSAAEDARVEKDALSQEQAKLQNDMIALQKQIEFLRDEVQKHSTLAVLVSQLQVANKNLVAASANAENLRTNAEAVGRRQNEFLAMLAHELRAPMAPITVATALLERLTDAHPKLPMVYGVIHRQVDNMTRLLDDLLDTSRVNTGKVTLARSPVLVVDLIQAAVETSQPFLDKRSHQLRVVVESDAMVIEGDPLRLAQVLSNLLINAAKFTPEFGEITLSAYRCAAMVEIAISDNGSGITADLLPHVFDLFTQGSRSLARIEGGLGVGLTLVRSIVEQHGGSVRADSDGPGCGSEFVVTLPLSS